MENKLSVSYWVERNKNYSIEVKAWFCGDWKWCTYVHIFESSSLFDKNQKLLQLGMHGGVTFNQEKVVRPIVGIGCESLSKIVGCDYMHLHDDYENHPSPFDYKNGDIPEPFFSDAKDLVKLINRLERN